MILSLYFDSDRTYYCIVEEEKKGLKLIDIDSTSVPAKLDLMPDDLSAFAGEIGNLIGDYISSINKVKVTIPSDNVIVTQFPGSDKIEKEELIELLNFEIRQLYPEYTYDQFASILMPLLPVKQQNEMLLAAIISKQDLQAIEYIANDLGLNVDSFGLSQLNAHNSYLYNYPEAETESLAFLGVQKEFMDVSVIKGKKLVYYNLASIKNKEIFAETLESEFQRIFSDYIDEVGAAYFFGAGLDIGLFNTGCSILNRFIPKTGRLNAFRMVSSALERRAHEYCSRTAHIFPPCIGGCIESYFEFQRI